MPRAFGRFTSRFILSGLSESSTILFVMRYVDCRGECGRCQLMMQDLIGLEVLSNRRIVASTLFAREVLVGRVDCVDLAFMIRFEEVPY
jgi:hypothetical protein